MRFDALLSGAFVGQFLLVCLFGTALVAVGVACGLAVARHRHTPGPPRVVFSDADLDFMTGLSTLDREAAEVAMLACRHSQDAAVRALALDVVAEQHERLGRVAGWRDLGAPDVDQPIRSDTGPLRVLRRATGRRFDVLFLEWLLRNREDTMSVAESVVDVTGSPAVAAVAEEILTRHEQQQLIVRDMAVERGRRSYR
jgi:uncharacterized protein (DUF305 family)